MTPAARIRPAPLGPGNASHNDFPRPRGKALGNGCSGFVLIGGRGDTGRMGDGDGRGAGRGFSLWPGLCAERAAYLGAMVEPQVVRHAPCQRRDPTFNSARCYTLVRVSRGWGVFLSYARAATLRRFSSHRGNRCRRRHRRTTPGHGATKPLRRIWIRKRLRRSCLLCFHTSPASLE